MNLPEIAKVYFHFNPEVLDKINSLKNKTHKSLFKPIFKNDEIPHLGASIELAQASACAATKKSLRLAVSVM